jgi:hypothetical protein
VKTSVRIIFKALILVCFACGTGQSVCFSKKTLPVSGHLSNYPREILKPSRAEGPSVWRKETFVLTDYRKFMIDPVVIFLKDARAPHGIRPRELNRLTDIFQASAASIFTNGFSLAGAPANDVIRIRVAIVNVVSLDPASIPRQQMPPHAIHSARLRPMPVSTIDISDAGIELEFLDSQTGEQLLAYLDRPPTGKQGNVAPTHSWTQVRAVASLWAQHFRQIFDTLTP